MKFASAKEMLDYINDNHDLYSPTAETYVFNYNDVGSICTYSIDAEEATELAKEVAKNPDELYWGALLGPGGEIWDDTKHDCWEEGQATNLDCCESLIKCDDWILCEEFLTNKT